MKPSKELLENGTWSPEDKKSFAKIIGRIFDLQKQFGKNTAQLENVVEGFLWALNAYPINKVIYGLQQYILTKNDMPTPSDIRRIIDPVKEPFMFDKTYYSNLKETLKNQGEYSLNDDELGYIRGYEANRIREFKGS